MIAEILSCSRVEPEMIPLAGEVTVLETALDKANMVRSTIRLGG